MRVSTALMTLLAATNVAFGRTVVARSTKTLPLRSDSELSRRASELITARQFHYLQTRAPLLDVCASINTDTILGNSEILGIPLKDLLGLDLCLCLSAFPLKLGLSLQLDALINKYGAPLINAVLELLIDLSSNKQSCSYPEFSTPICSSTDPCGFTCNAPYTKVGDQCACEAPYTLCNGQCISAPGGVCSSASVQRRAHRDNMYQNARSECRAHEEVCGVYDGSAYDYDCVDTKKNMESCGGCVIPNPFLSSSSSSPVGVDCGSIAHVDSVSCVSGRCVVESCQSGWEADEARLTCKKSGSEAFESSSSTSMFNVLADLLNVKRDEHKPAVKAGDDFVVGAFW
ncbi:hypothetical protein BC835DRAFT_1502679 [Cytidiella melzeri]|nr:hypothetical protein BC835DRAFT_1502679 [Cytidiella melzeri]